MLATEMMKLFYDILENTHDRFESIDRPLTDTVFRFLNDAYFEQFDSLCRAETFPTSVQKTRANLESLRLLVQTDTGTLVADVDQPGRYTYDLEDLKSEYAHFVRAEVSITRTAVPVVATLTFVETNPLHESEVDSQLITVSNSPIIREPGITFNNSGNIVVFVDEFTTAAEIRLKFVSRPALLYFDSATTPAVECKLSPEALCRQIVKRAVDMFITTKTMFAPKQEKK